jgi:CHAT domain-containing protein
LKSFIVFNPIGETDSVNHLLYAQEIYDLDLDSTRLVVLSACETGTGQLIHGEGLMSLSRAFAYAGCPGIVTSLWKAEDKTTAFLTGKFHHYLEQGYLTDEALQKAKLDLLNSDDMDPRFKSPAYWAHLVFIGPYEPRRSSQSYWWLGGFVLLALLAGFYIIRKKRRANG